MSKAREYALEQRVNRLNAIVSEQSDTIEELRKGRTCHVVGVIRYDYEYRFADSKYEFELSCGHMFYYNFNDAPNYCPWCGAKVVEQ